MHEQLFVDEPETEDDSKYYQQVQVNYVGALDRARTVRHETTSLPGSTDSASANTSSLMESEMLNLLCLPKVELEVFTGDPLKFHALMKSVQVNSHDPDSKLAQLLQYTLQEAHQAICGASIIGGQEGYDYALKTL